MKPEDEQRIIDGISRAQRMGWQIIAGSFINNHSRGCCPLTSALLDTRILDNRTEEMPVIIAKVLDWTADEVWAFIEGFDDVRQSNRVFAHREPVAYRLGCKFRALENPLVTVYSNWYGLCDCLSCCHVVRHTGQAYIFCGDCFAAGCTATDEECKCLTGYGAYDESDNEPDP